MRKCLQLAGFYLQPVGPTITMLDFADLDLVVARVGLVVIQAFVMVVARPLTEPAWRVILPNDIIIQHVYLISSRGVGTLASSWTSRGSFSCISSRMISVAQIDTFITNEHGRPRNQLANLVLALAAKRTIEEFAVLVLTAGFIAHTGVASVT